MSDEGGLEAALKLWLRAEYDAREGAVAPDELRARLAALAPLLESAHRLGGFAALPPGARLLDAGCGSGLFLAGLLQRAPHLSGLGVDLSPGAVAGAARSATALGLSEARFEAADLEALPYARAAFAGAVCAFALNLVPSKARVLGELARVLAPGARLVVVDSVLPGRVADSGSEALEGLVAKAAAAGLQVGDVGDVTGTVRELCREARWPWSGALRDDARILVTAFTRTGF